MLLGNLYNFTITNFNVNDVSVSLVINKDHKIFQGHFPEMPVLPGVCQILMVKEILCSVLKRNLQLVTSKSIKFLAIIDPEKIKHFNATISFNETPENTIIVNALLFSNEQNFLKMKGEFREKERPGLPPKI